MINFTRIIYVAELQKFGQATAVEPNNNSTHIQNSQVSGVWFPLVPIVASRVFHFDTVERNTSQMRKSWGGKLKSYTCTP